MTHARLFLLVPAILFAWGCTEAVAPITTGAGVPPVDVAATFSRDDDDDEIDPADHDNTGHDDNGRDDRFQRIDIHAVNVSIETMAINSVVIDLYSFHVKGRAGDMKGKFKLYQLRSVEGEMEAEVIASGEMLCGTVVGNKARVAGRITQTSFPEGLPVNLELIWGVTDNGRGENAPDTGSQPLGLPPLGGEAYCLGGGFPPEQPVGKGQVKIRS